MRIIINLAIAFSLFLFSTITFSQTYKSHKSMLVNTLPMQYELAVKVIPVVRTFLMPSGHIAHVKGSNQIVVVAKPETLRVFQDIFSSLTLANFDQVGLRFKLGKRLKHNYASSLTTKVIDIKNVDPDVLISALRTLVSKEGGLRVLDNSHQVEIMDYPIYVDDIAKLISQLDSKQQPKI